MEYLRVVVTVNKVNDKIKFVINGLYGSKPLKQEAFLIDSSEIFNLLFKAIRENTLPMSVTVCGLSDKNGFAYLQIAEYYKKTFEEIFGEDNIEVVIIK